MAYFVTQDTYITVGASAVVISAILSQKTKGKDDDKVISCASRALTQVERRSMFSNKKRGAFYSEGCGTLLLAPVWQRIYTYKESLTSLSNNIW